MVYFTCGACGEQIKKPQVEKHYTQKCRNCTLLTCIDCLKDFYGDEYKSHNQCMSEAQRYSKEGRDAWDPTVGQGNKGEKKQQEWIGKLRQLLDTVDDIDPAVRNIVETILDHENIPRKQPKFVNFVKNIMRNKAQMTDIESTWELFSQALKPTATPPANNDSKPAETEETKELENDNNEKKKNKNKNKKRQLEETEEEESTFPAKNAKKNKNRDIEEMEEDKNDIDLALDDGKSKKKKKKGKGNKENHKEDKKGGKRKLEESMEVEKEEEQQQAPPVKKAKFDWDETITALLQQNEMKLNKLKKKCVAEFFSVNENAHQTPEEIGAKFDKKIRKKKYKILKDRVRLSEPEETSNDLGSGASQVETTTNGDNSAKSDLSFNKWEAASLGNSAQTEKFRRLMGIKTDKPPEAIDSKKRDDKKMFRELEDGFEKARQTHFKAKGMGLGFS